MACREDSEETSCSAVPFEKSILTGRAENALIIGAGQQIGIAVLATKKKVRNVRCPERFVTYCYWVSYG